MALRPDLAGKRLQGLNDPAVYLVDDNGSRRWIPNPPTYGNLFRDWNGIEEVIDINDIDRGPDISDGAILAKNPNLAPVYLVDNGQKRWITSPAVMDKFYFSWNTIQSVPNIVLSFVSSGSDII